MVQDNRDQERVLGILRERSALIEGHFLLSSGKHSAGYVQCALLLQHPDATEQACAILARRYKESGVQVVVAPAVGGIVVSYELARLLGVRGIFMERTQDGELTLRRGFAITPGEKVLVAEDVITTGGSVEEVIAQVKKAGGEIVGVAVLIDRSGGADLGYPVESCACLEIPTHKPDSCPLCTSGIPIVKPGSRNLP